MPPRKNPLKLNKLQLKTLTILQELAESDLATPGENEGEVRIGQIPQPHQDHFHIGEAVIFMRDATGLTNRGVWAALDRKGLIRAGVFPFTVTLTAEGLAYDTGLREQILHKADH
jgi:hypothetical protein